MTDRGTMREITHVPPEDPVERTWFRRAPATAADGGDADEEPDRDAEPGRDASGEPMKDVSHTPKHGHGADRVWDGTRVHERDDDTDDE